jgi:hypothetical protein
VNGEKVKRGIVGQTLMGSAVLSALVLTGRAQSPPFPLRGRVVAAETGTPLRRARIQAIAANQTLPPVFTDADGRFVMTGLAAGPARVSVTKAGYVETTVPAASTGEEVELRLPKAGAIAGRITDTLGDPVIGMTVTAEISGSANTERRVLTTAETDDRGAYRLGALPAGRFLVSVNEISPMLAPDGTLLIAGQSPIRMTINQNGQTATSDDLRTHARVYYPGVDTLADALPIALASGEEQPTIDFVAPVNPPIDMFGMLGARMAPRGGALSNATSIIRGRVAAADGRSVPHAMVRLASEDAPTIIPGAVTDQDGQYAFEKLIAATYTVTAAKPGFLTTAYGQRRPPERGESIELRSGDTREHVDIALSRPGALVGQVVDEAGEPIEGAGVHVLEIQYRDGRRRLVEASGQGTHRTDDRGAYRVYGLPPGAYVVSATVGQLVLGSPMVDVPGYTTTYFPGTTNASDAQRIIVDGGQDVTGLDFGLARAPTARISGTIVDASGQPIGGGLVLTPSRRSGALATEAVGARIDRDGRFEFPNVAPGEYVIQASKGKIRADTEGESVVQFVTMNGSDVTGLMLRMVRGSTLKGRLTFEGQPYPELYSALNLQAVPVDMDRTPQNFGGPASAQIQPNGTFEMGGASGPRVLRLTDAPRGWMLQAVRLNGRDVTDTPLPFGTADQSIADLDVVLTDRVSDVTGRAVDARGRNVPGATVVVFSTDRQQWGETSRFLSVSGQTERDGAFTVGKLPPGDYYAAAITALSPGEWRDPDLLDALLPSATHLSVSPGETVTATLRVVTR